jgi:hypothetical protein
MSALKIAEPCEALVTTYKTTRIHNPEDNGLNTTISNMKGTLLIKDLCHGPS